MSPLYKRWLAATAVIAAIVVPLPATPAAASAPHVTFAGKPVLNLGVLSCPSTPDVANLTVAKGATVDFVNVTGKTATLHDGASSQTVANGGSASVAFGKAGTVSVTMVPACTLDEGTHKAMRVQVCAGQEPTTPPPTTAPTPPAGAAATHVSGKTVAITHTSPTPSHAQAGHTSTARPSPQPTPSSIDIGSGPIGGTRKANATLVLIAASGIICVFTLAVRRLITTRAA